MSATVFLCWCRSIHPLTTLHFPCVSTHSTVILSQVHHLVTHAHTAAAAEAAAEAEAAKEAGESEAGAPATVKDVELPSSLPSVVELQVVWLFVGRAQPYQSFSQAG